MNASMGIALLTHTSVKYLKNPDLGWR